MKKTLIAILALGSFAMSGIASAALQELASMSDLLEGATLGTGVTNTSDLYSNDVTVLNFAADNNAVFGITNSTVADIINAKTGYLTIAAWINPTATNGDNAIFSYGPQRSGIKVGIKDGRVQETAKWVGDHTMDGEQGRTNADPVTANGGWQFVAFSIALNGSSTSRMLMSDDASRYWSNQAWQTANDVPAADQLFGIGSAWGTAKADKYLGDIANLTLYYSTSAATAKDLQDAGITNLKPIALPEPATATLSLLALAGLAARRRRH